MSVDCARRSLCAPSSQCGCRERLPSIVSVPWRAAFRETESKGPWVEPYELDDPGAPKPASSRLGRTESLWMMRLTRWVATQMRRSPVAGAWLFAVQLVRLNLLFARKRRDVVPPCQLSFWGVTADPRQALGRLLPVGCRLGAARRAGTRTQPAALALHAHACNPCDQSLRAPHAQNTCGSHAFLRTAACTLLDGLLSIEPLCLLGHHIPRMTSTCT